MTDLKEYKEYIALILTDTDSSGRRVRILAKSLSEARDLLESEYGKGSVFDLHNREDADKPR